MTRQPANVESNSGEMHSSDFIRPEGAWQPGYRSRLRQFVLLGVSRENSSWVCEGRGFLIEMLFKICGLVVRLQCKLLAIDLAKSSIVLQQTFWLERLTMNPQSYLVIDCEAIWITIRTTTVQG